MSVRIASARPEDCGTVFGLIRALAEYERLSHLVVGSEDDLRAELFGVHPVIESVLAWDGEAAVGFALFFHNYSTFLARRGLYLEDLFVVPEARGRGIGKALITHCARVAVTRGCGRFEWSVLDWNAPAIAFYQSLGAELLPDWRICRLAGDSLQRFGDAAAARQVATP
ncbi:MAG TPA: GNAT family N-acetyltransferase [Burkholderiaceae bacterium]|nr:GNAT family N-acetyltransferase [Burkholderiaceae bacterium]